MLILLRFPCPILLYLLLKLLNFTALPSSSAILLCFVCTEVCSVRISFFNPSFTHLCVRGGSLPGTPPWSLRSTKGLRPLRGRFSPPNPPRRRKPRPSAYPRFARASSSCTTTWWRSNLWVASLPRLHFLGQSVSFFDLMARKWRWFFLKLYKIRLILHQFFTFLQKTSKK